MSRLSLIGLVLALLGLLLSACSATNTPAPQPMPPVTGGGGVDEPLPMPPVDNGGGTIGGGNSGGGVGTRTPLDPAALSAIDLLQMESMPVQYLLQLKGYKSPCEELEYTVSEPDDNGKINITAEWVSTAEACIAIAQEFQIGINLGSFPAGKLYSVWLNGVKVAEFRP